MRVAPGKRPRVEPAASQIVDAAASGLGADERRNVLLVQHLREIGSQREDLAQVIEGILIVVKLDVPAPAIVDCRAPVPLPLHGLIMIRGVGEGRD